MSTSEPYPATLRRWYTDVGYAHVSVLRWYHTVGYARHGGVSVDMREPPDIQGEDIEYLGGHMGKIDGQDMTPEEVSYVRKLLVQMSEDARDALRGTSTLVVVYQTAP